MDGSKRRNRTTALTVGVLLVLGAGIAGMAAAQRDDEPSGMAAAQRDSEPSLRIVRPDDGSEVRGADVDVVLQVEGVELVGERSSGGAFVLLQLDGTAPVKCYSDRFTYQGVAAGAHTLRAELRRGDGTAFEPPVRADVRFTLVEARR